VSNVKLALFTGKNPEAIDTDKFQDQHMAKIFPLPAFIDYPDIGTRAELNCFE
jgi:hypothetical protein